MNQPLIQDPAEDQTKTGKKTNMKHLLKALQYAVMVLSLMMLVFLVLDGFNPNMNFLRNDITKALLWVYALLCLGDGILFTAFLINGRMRTGKRKPKSESSKRSKRI